MWPAFICFYDVRRYGIKHRLAPSSTNRQAAIGALDGPRNKVQQRLASDQARRDSVYGRLQPADHLDPFVPEGAFCMYVGCSKAVGKRTLEGDVIGSSTDFEKLLLATAGVAVMPAEAFYSECAFRISIASGLETLQAACDGIREACARLG